MATKKAPVSEEDKKRGLLHRAIILAYGEAFREQFGAKYVFNAGKDASALKRFILNAPDVTVDDFISACRSAWNGKNQFLRGATTEISKVICFWNDISAQASIESKTKKSIGGVQGASW